MKASGRRASRITKGIAARFMALPPKRRLLTAAASLALIGGLATAFLLIPRPQPVAVTAAQPAVTGPQKGTPTYDTVLPKGKSIDSLGGWNRVSPPDRNPVYAYVDTIGKTRVIVSEQALPDSFLDDPDSKTKELATAFNATSTLNVGSTPVYVGLSTGGVESVIFHTKTLLILMKADTSIDDAALKDYVNSLG